MGKSLCSWNIDPTLPKFTHPFKKADFNRLWQISAILLPPNDLHKAIANRNLGSQPRTFKKFNQKVSKANKSWTLLRYSTNYHYNLIFFQLAVQTKRITVYVANSIWLPYVDVRGTCTCISIHSTPDDWFYSRSASTSITTCAIGSVISNRPQWVLLFACYLSNIISLFIYPAILYRRCYTTCWVVSSENIIGRNRIWAQISTVRQRLL